MPRPVLELTFINYQPDDLDIDQDVWVVRQGEQVVFASLDNDVARGHLMRELARIARDCGHNDVTIEASMGTLTKECRTCGTVWEADMSDLDWTEMGQQP